MQNGWKLLLSIDNLRVLNFLLLNCDPDIFILLKLQNFFSFAELWNFVPLLIWGLNTLNYSKDKWVASAIPFEGVEFLLVDDWLEIFKRLDFIPRNNWSDYEKESFEVEAYE